MAPDVGLLLETLAQAGLPEPTVTDPTSANGGGLRLEWQGRDTSTALVVAPSGQFAVIHEPFPGSSFNIEGIQSTDVLIPVLRNVLRGFTPA